MLAFAAGKAESKVEATARSHVGESRGAAGMVVDGRNSGPQKIPDRCSSRG